MTTHSKLVISGEQEVMIGSFGYYVWKYDTQKAQTILLTSKSEMHRM